MGQELQKCLHQPNQLFDTSENLSEYEKLRVNALSQCAYSTYSQQKQKECAKKSMVSDKRLEKQIYSDHFKYTLQNRIKVDENTSVSSKPDVQENQSIFETDYSVGADDETDFDDMMLNEDYSEEDESDENHGPTNFLIERGEEQHELAKLKNHLLNLPKTRLTLKTTSIDCEQIDDE